MNPLSALSSVKNIGDDNVGNAKAIAAKRQMVAEYMESTAPAPTPAAPRGYKSSPADRVNPKARYGDRSGEQRIDTQDMVKPLGSFKKGGKVKKTGVYKLHAKEQVLNAKQTAKADKMGGMAAVLSGKK